MRIEIPLDEDVINAAVEKAIDEIDDILHGVDVEELVRERISDMNDSDILKGVDVRGLVRDEIAEHDILGDIDVEALVNDVVEDADPIKDIDIEKIVTEQIRRSLSEDDFRQYLVTSNRVKILEDELESLRAEVYRVKSAIANKSLCQARKWYQIW